MRNLGNMNSLVFQSNINKILKEMTIHVEETKSKCDKSEYKVKFKSSNEQAHWYSSILYRCRKRKKKMQSKETFKKSR